MAIARLEVEIGAEIKDFQSKLSKSLKMLDLLNPQKLCQMNIKLNQ